MKRDQKKQNEYSKDSYYRHLQANRDRSRCRKQRNVIERGRLDAIRQLREWGLA